MCISRNKHTNYMKSIHKAEFAARIKQAREARNESQRDVAKVVGVTKQAVSDWENLEKSTIPKGVKLEKLLSALEITLDNQPQRRDVTLELLGRSLDILQNEFKEHKLELASLKAMREHDIARLEKDKDQLYSQNVELLRLLSSNAAAAHMVAK